MCVSSNWWHLIFFNLLNTRKKREVDYFLKRKKVDHLFSRMKNVYRSLKAQNLRIPTLISINKPILTVLIRSSRPVLQTTLFDVENGTSKSF